MPAPITTTSCAEVKGTRLLPLAARHPRHFEAIADVLGHGEPGKQRIFLKHHPAISARARHRFAADLDRSTVRANESAQDIKERALAAAGRADDGDEFSVPHFHIDGRERGQIAFTHPVAFVEVLDAYADHTAQG
jgi:hypothetical protein